MDNQIIKPTVKKIKFANCIVVGGMIAFGKSTLAKAVSIAMNANFMEELTNDDTLAHMLLNKMYERENAELYGSVFQLYFVLNRFDKYKNNCNQKELTVFDRSIFEDWLFGHENIIRPSIFAYYDSLWKDIANDLVYQHGVPLLYVILDGDYQLFKERLFNRNRQTEIENYQKNEQYFQQLLAVYKDYMINVCNDFGINYLIVDANKPLKEKVDLVIDKIKTLTRKV